MQRPIALFFPQHKESWRIIEKDQMKKKKIELIEKKIIQNENDDVVSQIYCLLNVSLRIFFLLFSLHFFR